jgi:hypothetical protein
VESPPPDRALEEAFAADPPWDQVTAGNEETEYIEEIVYTYPESEELEWTAPGRGDGGFARAGLFYGAAGTATLRRVMDMAEAPTKAQRVVGRSGCGGPHSPSHVTVRDVACTVAGAIGGAAGGVPGALIAGGACIVIWP